MVPPCPGVLSCIWNLVQIPLPSALSECDSCPGKTLMWGQNLGQREGEGYSPVVSDLSSWCPPHISACWQLFGAITCLAVTDLCMMHSVHFVVFVWNGRKCAQSQKQHWLERQDREQEIHGCWWDVKCCEQVFVTPQWFRSSNKF